MLIIAFIVYIVNSFRIVRLNTSVKEFIAVIVLGYREAWIQLRKSPNEVTGQMRTGVDGSLDLYHLADYYTNAPTLNEQFINETSTYFDRVLTVKSDVLDQFIVDFYIQNIAYRRLPTYSVPSLIDHN